MKTIIVITLIVIATGAYVKYLQYQDKVMEESITVIEEVQ